MCPRDPYPTTRDLADRIDAITDDEDERQDLWVFYLSGGDVEDFQKFLEERKREQETEAFRSRIYFLLKSKMKQLAKAMATIRKSKRWRDGKDES